MSCKLFLACSLVIGLWPLNSMAVNIMQLVHKIKLKAWRNKPFQAFTNSLWLYTHLAEWPLMCFCQRNEMFFLWRSITYETSGPDEIRLAKKNHLHKNQRNIFYRSLKIFTWVQIMCICRIDHGFLRAIPPPVFIFLVIFFLWLLDQEDQFNLLLISCLGLPFIFLFTGKRIQAALSRLSPFT